MSQRQDQPRHRAKIDAYNAAPKTCMGCPDPIILPYTAKIIDIKRRTYCSRSCSVKHTNVIKPRTKRYKARTCDECRNTFKTHGATPLQMRLCYSCWLDDCTKLERRTKAECNHRMIRAHARQMLPPTGQKCSCCDYRVIVEVCHLTPVSKFPSTAPLSEINAPTNLVLLCPNHHAELDKGLLDPSPLKALAAAKAPEAFKRRFSGRVRGKHKPLELADPTLAPVHRDLRYKRRSTP